MVDDETENHLIYQIIHHLPTPLQHISHHLPSHLSFLGFQTSLFFSTDHEMIFLKVRASLDLLRTEAVRDDGRLWDR